jgi:hypothetical protein
MYPGTVRQIDARDALLSYESQLKIWEAFVEADLNGKSTSGLQNQFVLDFTVNSSRDT